MNPAPMGSAGGVGADKMRPAQKKPEPGTLIIHDNFRDPANPNLVPVQGPFGPVMMPSLEPQHGDVVTIAAQQDGFHGPIQKYEAGLDPTSKFLRADQALQSGPLSKEQARQAVADYTSDFASNMLKSESKFLDSMSNLGTKNSAVNMSSGTSKARIALDLFEGALPGNATSQFDHSARVAKLKNLATAYDLDYSKLQSRDTKICAAEINKLQQGLVNQVSDTLDNSQQVKDARATWDTSVRRFESGNNSVVISAGNEGEHRKYFENYTPGEKLKLPQNFTTNVLENDQVTSVGATRWMENSAGELKEYRAGYSSKSNGVDIYASGSVGLKDPSKADEWGTSFAAPKVAAGMAALHKQNPEMSSAQVEALMRKKLTHPLNTSSGTLEVLDYKKNFEFLSSQTY